ncbi:MAG: long-chain fatty acid--CoA ligase, partial [Sulfurimonadaceae bacterium]|nr:long-chain fatty acid--CoA ligase [Sulfurimonadaceae bacterium]
MSFFVENFAKFKELNALNHYDMSFTYEELYNKILTIKKEIQTQIPSKSVVAILGDYSFENIALFFALYENKNIIVPITSQVKNVQDVYIEESFTEFVVHFQDSNLHIAHIKNSTKHDMLQTLQEKNQAGLVLFSSGSTGKPKAMIHNLDTLMDSYKDKRPKAMNMLVFLMFDH